MTRVANKEAFGIQLLGDGARALNNDITQVTATGTYEGVGLSLAGGRGSIAENNRIENVSSDTGSTFGITVIDSLEALAVGNRITNVEKGINYEFVTSSGKYGDNLTSNVTTPFIGGFDAGGNN